MPPPIPSDVHSGEPHPGLDAPTEIDPHLAVPAGGASKATATAPERLKRASSGVPANEPRRYSGGRPHSTLDRDGDALAGQYELRGVGSAKGPLGRGAFGEVWQAYDRTDRRDVALKILRQCRAEVLARFELERQLIARMEHPNIARIFKGGTLEDGRPFLAMELIRGLTLTEYCSRHRLSRTDRLRLFVPICRAVQHAHDRFVLHRDLKPSNIMVVEHDGQPVPKVIDFGIAKVLQEGDFSPEAAAATVDGSIKGTPAYMSPEQTRRDEVLTVRSDVYTLGTILFELLTGDTPLSHRRTQELDFYRLVGAICLEPAAAPSVRLAQRHRQPGLPPGAPETVFPVQPRELRGDVDTIVLRALQKEPAQRYQSAAELADDLERHLHHEPILARPPSAWYRAAKFLQRHRAVGIGVLVAAAALLVTAVVATTSYYRVRTSLAREQEARQAADLQRAEAVRERTRAEEARHVAELKEAEARQAREVAVLARGEAEDLLNYLLFDLRQQLEPLGRSRLLASVSEKAEHYFSRQPVLTGNDALERNRAVMLYNRGYILLAQGEVARAVAAFRSARVGMEQRLALGQEPSRQMDLATASHGLGLALRASGEPEKARPLFEEILPFLRARHASRQDFQASRLLAATLEQLGELHLREGAADAALVLFQEQEARLREVPDPSEPRAQLALAVACEKVGGALQRRGRPDEALRKFQEQVAILRTLSGQQLDDLVLRRHLAVALEKLGNVLLTLNRAPDAKKLFEERLQESELLARVDPRRLEFRRDVAVAHQRLSSALLALGDASGARREALADLSLSTSLVAQYPGDRVIAIDLACAQSNLGYLILKTGPQTPAVRAEARSYFSLAAHTLRRLLEQGALDERVRSVLAELEKTLTELR